MNEPADVFISCSKAQSTQVAKALVSLIKQALNLTVYLHKEQTAPGEWTDSLIAAIFQCKVHVFCINSQNIDAPWIMFEAGLSWKKNQVSKDGTQLVLVLDDTPLVSSPLWFFREMRLEDATDRREFMKGFLSELLKTCQAAGRRDARFAAARKVNSALNGFLADLGKALQLPARRPLQAVGRDRFYEEMKKSIVDASRLDLIHLSPGEIAGEPYRHYKEAVAQKIAAKLPVRRIVAVNELERLRELVDDLYRSRDKVDFHVALAHESCYSNGKLPFCPLPPNMQIVERKGHKEVFVVDPVNGCHQRSDVTSTSFIIDNKEFSIASAMHFDRWWRICEEHNLVVRDAGGIHIQPLLDRLEYVATVGSISPQIKSDLQARIESIDGAS